MTTVSRSFTPSIDDTTVSRISASLAGLNAFGSTITGNDYLTTGRRGIQAPDRPWNFSVQRTSDYRHVVSWDAASSTSEAPVHRYVVERWDSETEVWRDVGSTPGLAFVDDSTKPNVRYRWGVRSTNTAGDSERVLLAKMVSTTPAPPTSVAAARQGTDIEVGFDIAGPVASKVEIWHAANGVRDPAPLATVARSGGHGTWVHKSPSTAVSHQYWGRAVTTDDVFTLTSTDSVPSPVVNLLAAPAAPTQLTPHATAFDAARPYGFRWRHNPTDTSGQTAYRLRYRVVGASSWTETAKAASRTEVREFTPGTFANGKTYEWQVQTWGDHADASPWSETVVFRTSAAPSATVTKPGATVESARTSVAWTFHDPEGAPQSAYRVRLESADGVTLHEVSRLSGATRHAIPVVLADSDTYVVVVAVCDAEGVWSEEVRHSFVVKYAQPGVPQAGTYWDLETGAVTINAQAVPARSSAWEGTPGESVSIIKDASGNIHARNYAFNGGGEYSGREIVIGRNFVRNGGFNEGGHNGAASPGWFPVRGTIRQGSEFASKMWAEDHDGPGVSPTGMHGTFTSIESSVEHAYLVGSVFSVTPGQWVGARAVAACDKGVAVHMSIQFRRADGTYFNGVATEQRTLDWYKGGVLQASVRVPNDATSGRLIFWLHTNDKRAMPAGRRMWLAAVRATEATSEALAVAELAVSWWESGLQDPDVTVRTEPSGVERIGVKPRGLESRLDLGAYVLQSNRWASQGKRSIRLVTTGGTTDTYIQIPRAWYEALVGKQARISFTARIEHAFTGQSGNSNQTCRVVAHSPTIGPVVSPQFPSTPGEHKIDAVINLPSDVASVRIYAGYENATLWLDNLAITGPEYSGDYVDGDSATALATTSLAIYRKREDGTWMLVAGNLPSSTAVTDPIPPLDREVEYRVTATSSIGSERDTIVTVHTRSRGWVFVNHGQGFTNVTKVRDNAAVEFTPGQEKVRKERLGRTYPTEIMGDHRTGKVSLSAQIGGGSSTYEEWEELTFRPAPLCYRDPFRKVFVSVDPVATSFKRIKQTMSVAFEQVHHVE